MPISNDLLSTTLYSIRDKQVDGLFKKNAFLAGAKSCGGMETEDGGTHIVRPLAVADHSSITAQPTGYEPVNMAVSNVLRPATYYWADFVAPIVISRKEEMENRGEKAQIKIIEARTKSVFAMFRRSLNKRIIHGGGGVSGLEALNTLNGVYEATGFIENGAPAAATQTNTVGGLNKATLNIPGWFNQHQDISASNFSTDGEAAMQRIWTAANSVSETDLDLVLASQAGFSNYKRGLRADERYVDVKTLDGGRMSLAFNSATIEQDLDMPINAGVGTDEFTFYFLYFDGIKLIMHDEGDFAASPFENIPGTTTRAAQIYWKGQLVADHLGSIGVLVGGDTW